MRKIVALLALALSGCATPAPPPADVGATFDPVQFFLGRTQGEGVLRTALGRTSRISVQSAGRVDERGNLILDQWIKGDEKRPRMRRWVMRRAGPSRLTGTLTDAVGPVEITVSGPRATIRYQMKGGLPVEQRLAIQPGGRTVLNQLTVRRFGVQLARLDETIRKLD